MDLPCTESARHGHELQGTEWRGNVRKGNGVEKRSGEQRWKGYDT